MAEVLITLGVIGVVAAMTLPTVISNYQKKVTAVRLKQFSSIWQQAYIGCINLYGNEKFFGSLEPDNPDSALDFYNEYYGRFVRTEEVNKSPHGIVAGLPNGSGFYFYRLKNQAETHSLTYLMFCTYYKDCVDLANNVNLSGGELLADGKKIFTFYLNGRSPVYGWDGSRTWLMNRCNGNIKEGDYTQKGYCTKLIEVDGWEIKDDYPW